MPATRKWKTVADMIERGSAINDIAAASAKAAERELARAADDPVFVEAVRLLALIPQAAKQEGFGKALLAIGIDAPADPSLMDLMVATTAALDRFAMREGHRSDFGKLSARALSDSPRCGDRTASARSLCAQCGTSADGGGTTCAQRRILQPRTPFLWATRVRDVAVLAVAKAIGKRRSGSRIFQCGGSFGI